MIQSGVENLDSGVGIYAPDAEAYSVFAPLFDPVIEDYHGGFSRTDMHPPPTYEGNREFGDLDPDGRYIASTRIRCGRSIKGIPFNPNMSEDDYLDMEKRVAECLGNLGADLAGDYRVFQRMCLTITGGYSGPPLKMATSGQAKMAIITGWIYYPIFYLSKNSNSFTKVATLTGWIYYPWIY